MKIIIPPFGSHALPYWREWFLRCSQNMPVSWLGRRLALVARRIALLGWNGPVDAYADGFRMRVHPRDNVSERKFLFMPQFVDPAERAYIRERLPQGGVFLDIGANAGIYSLTAARALQNSGKGSQVIAFEPNPIMLERLDTNLALNDYTGLVQIFPLALSDQTGEIEFTVSDTNLGESGLSAGSGKKIRVATDTLFNILTQAKVDKVTGLKIDVEGLEDTVLIPFFEQAQRTLYPKFIIIENSQPHWKKDLIGALKKNGYQLQAKLRMNSIYTLE